MSRELLDALFESWLKKNVSYFTNIVAEFKDTEGKVTSLKRGWNIGEAQTEQL